MEKVESKSMHMALMHEQKNLVKVVHLSSTKFYWGTDNGRLSADND